VEGFSVETIANRTSADYDERYADLQAIVTL